MPTGEFDTDVTDAIAALADGSPGAATRWMPVLYGHLRSMAEAHLAGERTGHTLQPTAIVHEAYMRLVQAQNMQWTNRAHFMAVAAGAIRRVLIDHARRTNAQKRGGERQRVALADDAKVEKAPDVDLLDLNDALDRLAAMNPRQSRLVELRFFGGLTNEEVASVMGLSRATISDEWAFARAWLAKELEAV